MCVASNLLYFFGNFGTGNDGGLSPRSSYRNNTDLHRSDKTAIKKKKKTLNDAILADFDPVPRVPPPPPPPPPTLDVSAVNE